MVKGQQWLDQHLEEFVRPILGTIPNIKQDQATIAGWKPVVLDAFKECWEIAKKRAKGHPIVCPGRDAWEFEILARLEGYETAFLPNCSSVTKTHFAPGGNMKCDFSQHFGVDSGLSGSVPRALKCFDFAVITGNADKMFIKEPNSPYPACRKDVHPIYGLLEGGPKYWVRATCGHQATEGRCNGVIEQAIAHHSFTNAAMVTQHIAKYCMPPAPRVFVSSIGRLL